MSEAAARQLQTALHKEADRRQAMDHYVVAHELRKHASNVSSAEAALRASKQVTH